MTDVGTGDATDREELIARIMQAQSRLQHLFAQDRSNPLFTSNLTMSQLKTLFVLQHRGACGGQDLARAMGVSLATMTGIVDRLVSQALVTRREDPNDRRVRRVELSPQGLDLVDGIITAGAEHQRRLMERMDLTGLRIIERASAILEEALAAEAAEVGTAAEAAEVGTAAEAAEVGSAEGQGATACPGSAAARTD